MTFKKLLDDQVAKAFTDILGKGGLTENITLRYINGQPVYDPVNDTTTNSVEDLPLQNIVICKITDEDVKNYNVMDAEAKVLIPGKFIARLPEADTDRVVRSSGLEWTIKKRAEVPGGSLVILFICRT
jgi:hypothetical protein